MPQASSNKSDTTRIISCSCANDYQDKRYGAGKRVHIRINSPAKHNANWRCTVCSSKKQ